MNKKGGIYLLLTFLSLTSWSQVDTTIELKAATFVVSRIYVDQSHKIETLDSALLGSYSSTELGEVLRRESELFIRDQGPGQLSTASFRGTGAQHTRFYFNGVPINSGMNGTLDLSLFSGILTDRIGIRYGASSMIDGDGGLGGSLQMSQESPALKPTFQVMLDAQVGSFGAHREALRLDYADSSWSGSSRVFYQAANNNYPYTDPTPPDYPEHIREQANYARGGVSQLLNFQTGKNSFLQANFVYLSADRNLPGPSGQNHPIEKQDDRLALGTLQYQFLGKKIHWIIISGIKHQVLRYENQGADLFSHNEENLWNSQVRVSYLLFKKIYMSSMVISDYNQAYNEEYGDWQSEWRGQMIHQAYWFLGKRTRWRQVLLLKSQVAGNQAYPLLPSFATRYALRGAHLQLRGSVAYHVARPTLNDRYWGVGGNPDLKDEEGVIWDFGIEGEEQYSDGIHWRYKIGYYYNQINNWILWVPESDGIWRVMNSEKVNAQGIEAQGGVSKNWQSWNIGVRAMYNYQLAQTQEKKQLIYTPQHRARINLDLGWKNAYLMYDHSYTGERYINPQNTAWMPDYFLADVRLGWKHKLFKKQLLIGEFGVLNLYDEPYQNIANRPMPGRNYYFKIRFVWL